MKKIISVLVPCFNEENNIEPMAEAITEQMRRYEGIYDYEIVFRDNDSTDKSLEVLRKLASRDKHIKVIVNARNYGIGGAKNTFIGRISGDAVITIPCDFQEPPELIPEFIQYWEQGYEAVCGQKTSSKEGRFKYGLRQLFYSIIDLFSEIPQYRNMSGIILLSRRLWDLKVKYNVKMPIRYFLADIGCDVKLVQYEQQKRRSGKSSYNVWRYLSFAIDSMITTSRAPLRVATVMGFIMSVVTFIIGMVYLVYKIVFWQRFSAGTAPILIGLFFLGSILLLFIGIVGEYVGAVLQKVTESNPPIVKELINFDNAEEDPCYIRGQSD